MAKLTYICLFFVLYMSGSSIYASAQTKSPKSNRKIAALAAQKAKPRINVALIGKEDKIGQDKLPCAYSIHSYGHKRRQSDPARFPGKSPFVRAKK